MTNRIPKNGNLVVSCELRAAKSSRRGFTLIEMITVLSIIIIVLAIALPVWRTLLGGTNLSAAQNEISATIANARADAIYNRQTIGVFFFIDPKTQQTGMAEVQVQTLYQPTVSAYGGNAGVTSLFIPGTWSDTAGSVSWTAASPWQNGAINSLERVNSPDPTNAGNFIFYRDVTLLPKGVAVALNNNTNTNPPALNPYNAYATWNPTAASSPGSAIDRYLRTGCIMFNPDGTLASIPWGIPYYEWFTATQHTNNPSSPSENLLCKTMGMPQFYDTASTFAPTAGPANVPLTSSVGLIIYDHDAYINQHATGSSGGASLGTGAQFSDSDMILSLQPTGPVGSPIGVPPNSGPAADKFLEEQWIDQNGTALLVSPFNGSLIKAK
jgi:prepilin-type N-terminal cleavage/methylation domain-containing protein